LRSSRICTAGRCPVRPGQRRPRNTKCCELGQIAHGLYVGIFSD
jgi:hypothetical protein